MTLELLLTLFNQWAEARWQTRLEGGFDEPLYLPAHQCPDGIARIRFTGDSENSALHEIAHWMIAGEERRKCVDYGYWYEPDGRSPSQQREFERVEVRPQALEWWFAEQLGIRFFVSADNLRAGTGPSPAFCQAVAQEAAALAGGERLPPRAREWMSWLAEHVPLRSVSPELFTTKRL